MTQYRRLDPRRGISDHIYHLQSQIDSLDTAPTGDVGLRGVLETVDPETGVSTLIGRLPDGTFGIQQFVNDTMPPGQPSTPTAVGVLGGIVVSWDGLEVGGTSQPRDYAKTLIQYSKPGGLWIDATTVYDKSVSTIGGLEIGIVHSIRLVSLDQNGNQSTPSAIVTATPTAAADNSEVNEAINDLRLKDQELTDAASDATEKAQQALDDLALANGAISAVEGRVDTAETNITDATLAAAKAQQDALAAAGLAGSKGKVWFQNDAPAEGQTYVWTGAVNNSVSIKRLNGTEQDRNLFVDPRATVIGRTWTQARWAGGGGGVSTHAIVNVTGPLPELTTAIRKTWTTAPTGNGDTGFDLTQQPVTAGTAYTLSGYLRHTSGTPKNLQARMTFYNASNVIVGSNNAAQVVVSNNTWTRIMHRATVPTGATKVGVLLDVVGGTLWKVGDTLEGTGAYFGQGPIDTPYFDGDFTDDRVSDLWVDLNDGNKPYRWNSATNVWDLSTDQRIVDAAQAASNAAQAALDANNLAKTKVRTFTGATAPTGLTLDNIGDLWINELGKVSRWQYDNGTLKWVLVSDNGTAAANKALSDIGVDQTWVTNIKNQADRAITTFYGPTTPTGVEEGDLWLNGTVGVPTKRWTNGAWVNFEDQQIIDAYGKAGEALEAADAKILTYAQTTAPTGLNDKNVGDLWINTTAGTGAGANQVSRWQLDAGTYKWVLVSDTVGKLTPIINDKGKVIIQSTAPVVADQLVQNLWIDTSNVTTTRTNADGTTTSTSGPGNIPKRWNTSVTPNAWVAVTEKAILDATASVINTHTVANNALEKAGLAMTSASERSRIVHLNTTPPAPADGWKDEDVWYKHKTIDIASPVIEWYRWKTGTGWVKQVMDETFIPILNIGTATTGFLKGTRIEAKSLSTEQLLITSLDNLVQDGDFSGFSTAAPYDAANPKTSWTWSGTLVSIMPGEGRGGANAMRFTGATTAQNSMNTQARVALAEGASYRGSIWVKSSAALPIGRVQFIMYCYTTTANTPVTEVVMSQNNAALVANTWTSLSGIGTSGTVKVPAGTIGVSFGLRVTNTATTDLTYVDSVQVTRAADGSLIVDGALTGKTINGALIQSNAADYTGIKLSGTELIAYDASATAAGETFRISGTTGAVTMKGSLTAGSSVTGAIVTGGLVQTVSTANRGIKLNGTDNTFRMWDSNGIQTLLMNGATGQFNAVGTISTLTASGAGIDLQSGPSVTTSAGATLGNSVIKLWTGDAQEFGPSEIFAHASSSGYPSLWLVGAAKNSNATTHRAHIVLGHGALGPTASIFAGRVNIDGKNYDGSWGAVQITNADFSVGGKMYATNTISTDGGVVNTASILRVQGFGGNDANGTGVSMYDRWSGSNVEVGNNSGGNFVKMPAADSRTTTRAANVNIYLDTLHRTTSATKYKLAIERGIDYSDKILSLEAATWFDKSEAEAVADWMSRKNNVEPESMKKKALADVGVLRRVPGMVAEDVEAAGLEEFVIYGPDGEIEGLMYERLAVALIPVVAKLRDRIVALEQALPTE